MDINKLEAEDREAVANNLRKYWKERGMDYSQEWAEKYVAAGHQIEIKKDQCFVLKENGKMLGSIAVVIQEGDVAELRDWVVKKEARGKGLGKKLLDYSVEYAKQQNARKIISLVFQHYRPFFEKQGFHLEGFLKDHFKEGEHLLLMSKQLKEKDEKQVDLKQKLDDVRAVQDIEMETAARLKKLAIK